MGSGSDPSNRGTLEMWLRYAAGETAIDRILEAKRWERDIQLWNQILVYNRLESRHNKTRTRICRQRCPIHCLYDVAKLQEYSSMGWGRRRCQREGLSSPRNPGRAWRYLSGEGATPNSILLLLKL
jgi:hypothetical protein